MVAPVHYFLPGKIFGEEVVSKLMGHSRNRRKADVRLRLLLFLIYVYLLPLGMHLYPEGYEIEW